MLLQETAYWLSHAFVAYEKTENAEKKGDTATETREVQLLRKLVKRSPHDTQARIFLAGALEDGYDDAGEPRAGQKEAVSIWLSWQNLSDK
jgi:hypothetical protein